MKNKVHIHKDHRRSALQNRLKFKPSPPLKLGNMVKAIRNGFLIKNLGSKTKERPNRSTTTEIWTKELMCLQCTPYLIHQSLWPITRGENFSNYFFLFVLRPMSLSLNSLVILQQFFPLKENQHYAFIIWSKINLLSIILSMLIF